MLKIIHCADIHLGAKMDSKFPREKVEERRKELLSTFENLINFAKSEGVKIIMLSGDVFDSDKPLKKHKEFFYSAVRNNPEIDFLYLRGNHDVYESIMAYDLENLKTFSEDWQYYHYGDITICGIELTSGNYNSLYSTLNLDKSHKNFIMLHGQISDSVGKDKISLSKLRNKNIDYLALGHIHSYQKNQLDDRGFYAYSGCLEGRGFDELDEKGFVLINVDEKNIETKFIPLSKRIFCEHVINVSNCSDLYSTIKHVKSTLKFDKNNVYSIVLTGETEFDTFEICSDLEESLQDLCYFCSVKDKTTRKFNISDFEGDLSLKGEFIRNVLSDEKLTSEQKQAIISYGIKALLSDEVEL